MLVIPNPDQETPIKTMGRVNNQFDGLAQDCNNSSALAMELLQSFTKPSTYELMQLMNITSSLDSYQDIVEQKVLKNMPSLNEAQLFEADQLDSVPTEEGQGHGSTFDLEAVKAALQKTAAAVQDLDAFLGSNGEVQPVKDPFH